MVPDFYFFSYQQWRLIPKLAATYALASMNNLLVFSDVLRQMAAIRKLYGNTSTGITAGSSD